MRQSRLLPFKDAIVAAYEGGQSSTALAATYHVPPNTVRHFLKRVCLVAMRPPHRGRDAVLTPEVERTIVSAYLAGDSANGISQRLSFPYSHVVSVLKRQKVHTHRRTRSPSFEIPTDIATLAYIAGLIDGEGSIRLVKQRDRRPAVYLQISNTDEQLMAWLTKIGGFVYWEKATTKNRRVKRCAAWRVAQAIDCYRLLVAILPFLIIKRAKAVKAVDVLQLRWGFK